MYRKSNFVHSSVAQPDGLSLIKDDYRSSSTAYLNRAQTPIVKCIEQRFARFQGDIDPTRIEPLQVVRYNRYEEVRVLILPRNTPWSSFSFLS